MADVTEIGKGRRVGTRHMTKSKALRRTKDLVAKGWTSARIAAELGLGLRTVKRYRRELLDLPPDFYKPDEKVPEEPIRLEDLAPEVRWRLEDTPEGYRRFCDAYWPEEPMPEHIFAFVRSGYEYAGECGRLVDGTVDGAGGEVQVASPDGLRRCGGPAAYRVDAALLCDACLPGYQALGGSARLVGRWKTRLLLNVPPEHAKTQYFNVRWCVWRVAQNRDWRIIVVSETGAISAEMVDEVATHFRFHEGLLADFGPFEGESHWQPSQGRFRVRGSALTRGYNIYARGMDQQIQSLRCDELILDDVISEDSVLTEERREKTLRKYRRTLVGRLAPRGIVRTIGSRQHIEDFYDWCSRLTDHDDKLVFEHITFPAVLDWEARRTLWPDRWPYEALMKEKYAELGANDFSLVYQQEPLPEGATPFRREWFYGRDDDRDPHKGCLDRDRAWGPRALQDGKVRVVSIDPSPTEYWGIVVGDVTEQHGVDSLYQIDVLEILRAKMSLRAAMDALERILRVYRPRYAIAEINAAQRWLASDLQWMSMAKMYSVTLLPHTTSRNRNDADWGVESLTRDVEFGRIRLPYLHGDPESVGQSESFIKEACAYPFGSTDDTLLAMWFPKANLFALRNRAPQVRGGPASGFRRPVRVGRGWAAAPA